MARKILYVCLCIILAVSGGFFLSSVDMKEQEKPSSIDTCKRNVVEDFSVMDPSFYKKDFSYVVTERNIVGGIVNHHLLASDFIEEVLFSLKKQSPKSIVLISPNHFNKGRSSLQTADLVWKSPLGEVKTPCDFFTSKEIEVEPLTFLGEHGISNIIPFIKKYVPEAEVYPIVVKENVSMDVLKKVALQLSLLPDTVFIGSFDFSHELPPLASAFRDERSKDAIKSFDFGRIEDVAVDSNKGLYLLMEVMAQKKAYNFKLFKNTNSGTLLEKNIPDSTSYITGVFTGGSVPASSNTNILFFGDLMLDRSVAKKMFEHGFSYPFMNMEHLLKGNDIVGANLEGVFTKNDSIAQKNNNILRFTFNQEIAKELSKLGFDIFSQANNHTNDFGREGIEESFLALHNQGMRHFGNYFNEGVVSEVVVKNNKRVAFVGFNEFSYKNYEVVFEEIRKRKADSDFVVVVPHWGDEYKVVAHSKQRKLARDFIDAGADIILGAHPHVVQNIDIYKDKLIFYSLGNFVFDQDFSKETTEGLGVGLSLKKDSVTAYLIPFDIKQSQVVLKSGEAVTEFLRRISSVSSKDLQEKILKGKIELYEK